MRIKNIIISLQTAKKLQEAGIVIPAVFSYFEDFNGVYFPDLTDADDDDNEGEEWKSCLGRSPSFAAYTAEELGSLLPGKIQVDGDTWITNKSGHKKISDADLDYSGARIQFTKAGGLFTVAYRFEGAVVAFSRNDGGGYNNMFISAESEAEARARMLLYLIEENKLENVNH